ncbi:MAG: hypothetical protein UH080_01425 [Ruminococcus sp.]|nr:hypothetical protein [Ruminococcus sp.]
MKVAVIGSRSLTVNNLEDYLPENITEIVSGGAKGIDTCAKIYANNNNLKLTEILPEYKLYGKAAPIKRNDKIIKYCDTIIAFWDGKSKGTKYVIQKCQQEKKELKVFFLQNQK